MATLPIRPLVAMHRLMGGIGLVRRPGTKKWTKTGPIDAVEFTPNITKVDIFSAETGKRRLIKKIATEDTAQVVLTGMQAWTEETYELLYLAAKRYLTQAALTNQTLIWPDVQIGDVFELPGRDATIDMVTGGSDGTVELVEDVHFIFSPSTRHGEIIALPTGVTAGTEIEFSYDLPAVTEADKILDLQIMEKSGTTLEFKYIGMSADGNGTPLTLYLPSVEFAPNGAISNGDASAANAGSLTGDVYSTSTLGYGSIELREEIVNA
ncbi:hypothetical protein [Pararhizobium sp.]|uniref:hypothetical protein n=1 Tax=Pararhizobium sp. TaxID=1977563 RepID=UPI003D125382